MKKKLVFIVSRFPWNLVKGDKLRAYHQIKHLSNQYDICLCALSDEKVSPRDIEELRPYCAEIHVFSLPKLRILINLFYYFIFTKKPVQVGYFYNKKIAKKIQEIVAVFQPNHVYCQLVRTAEYMRKSDKYPKTLDYMDALSAGMERRAESASSVKKILFLMEARRLKRYEHFIYSEFDHCTIISESDRQLIFQYNNQDIHIIPNGIDSDFFSPVESKKEYDLLFTGNMSYPPNVRTAEYLVKEIMPLIWAKRPETNLLISGANPVSKVKDLSSKNVTIIGWIDDIRSSYSRCRIFIAPMIIGSGLQNKLLEAMAMGLPCITSELANRSLGAEEGSSILVGNGKANYAEQILNLLENKKFADEIASKGHSFVTRNYNWETSNKKLLGLIEGPNG